MELPFQTYQRITGKTWRGGRSAEVVELLQRLRIEYAPGSAEANLCLQGALLAGAYSIF